MERNSSTPFPGRSATGSDPRAALFGRLDGLSKQVNELMNDPAIRRMVLEIGIVLLTKRYPALGTLMGSFGEMAAKKAPRCTVDRKPLPMNKIKH